MKCNFCNHEVAPGTAECPYCHYQFKIEAKVLSASERDTFDGVTIEEDGSSSKAGEHTRRAEYQEAGSFTDEPQGNAKGGFGFGKGRFGQGGFGTNGANGGFQGTFGTGMPFPGIKVRRIGCGTLLIICAVLALLFFMLPAFLMVAAIGAVIYFVMSLFG